MDIDWAAERARAASQTQRSLADLAERAGYAVDDGGKGSHKRASRPGLQRPVMIPAKIFRQNALGILKQLEEGAS